MSETISILPFSFWVAAGLLLAGAAWAATQARAGFGLPTMAVLATVSVWYLGDAIYNDYANNHAKTFTSQILNDAWWQVAWFTVVFLVLVPVMHRLLNNRELGRSSQVVRLLRLGARDPRFQSNLDQLFWAATTVWLLLVVIASIRLGDQILYYFFPFLGEKADPWGRGRIGGGMDAVLSLGSYTQIFVAAIFGVVAALARNGTVRFLAALGCCLTWPYYLFDRTRNTMLTVTMPAILSWVFLRLRGSGLAKLGALSIFFLLINFWLSFVIANRAQMSIADAFRSEGIESEQTKLGHHEGLNMFEELCWINQLTGDGTYKPNWGSRYFAEIVNPIPRALWPGKPLIGIDYAMARGQGYDEGGAGVGATISTGMIGQGVVNFGGILGPAFAALLMSIWVAVLAHLDLQGDKMGRIPLYALGMILTFNLGRDITLITLYTFIFGWIIVWALGRRENRDNSSFVPRRGKAEVLSKSRNPRNKLQSTSNPNPDAISSVAIVATDSSSKPRA